MIHSDKGKQKNPKSNKPKQAGFKSAASGGRKKPPPSKIQGDKKAPTGEKQDWNKFKQEKKDLKLKRKSARDTYEITKEVKVIYEKLKCRRTENKSKLVEEIYKIFNKNDAISKVYKAHDTARILQCMLKHAAPDLRLQLSDKLMAHSVEMCQSKYGHFCVERMLKYGAPATKAKLTDSLMGNIVRLSGHNIAAKLIDQIYLVATEKQRAYMRQEFYGDLYKNNKEDQITTLADTYKDSPNMKTPIMNAVKATVDHIANKNLIDNSLVHAIILEYLNATDDEKLEETVTALAPLVPHMLTTKEGTTAATICFYKSTSKNRRAIMKSIKEHLLKICLHEHGHVFLIALLNALDDTKAIKKGIYDPLHDELKTLVANQYGRRVLQWLVSPGDTTAFHPGFIQTIEAGLTYGKKDKAVRRQEILEQIEGPVTTAIVEDAAFWLSNKHIGLVTAAILKQINVENYEKAAAALAPVVVQADWRVTATAVEGAAGGKKQPHDTEAIIAAATAQRRQKKKQLAAAAAPSPSASESEGEDEADEASPAKKSKVETVEPEVPTAWGIEDAGMHLVLKRILNQDKQRDVCKFTLAVLEQLQADVVNTWLSINRGCFVLITLLENSASSGQDLVQIIDMDQLKAQSSPGAKILLKKIAEHQKINIAA